MNIVLFDGVCNLCNNTIIFLIKHDKKNKLHFAAQQTNAGERLMKQYHVLQDAQSVVFIKDKFVYYKSDAIIEIAKLLSGWPRIARIGWMVPRFLRDWIYDLIANNRYKIFGKKKTCALPAEAVTHKFIS
jgi:predicted DCC family thiol-disulfide oxidoreductase YuxK